MQNFIEKSTSKLKKAWGKQRRHGLKTNAKVSKKTCRKTTARKPTSLWKKWQARNKREILPSRANQGKVSQKTSWRGGQRTVPNCIRTHNNRRSQGARCPSTNQQWHLPYPAGRSWSGSKITEERQVGRSGQHSIGAGPGRRRGHERYVTRHLAIRSGRQESGQHLGLSPWSSLSQRKATYNYANTTIPSAWSVIQVRSW